MQYCLSYICISGHADVLADRLFDLMDVCLARWLPAGWMTTLSSHWDLTKLHPWAQQDHRGNPFHMSCSLYWMPQAWIGVCPEKEGNTGDHSQLFVNFVSLSTGGISFFCFLGSFIRGSILNMYVKCEAGGSRWIVRLQALNISSPYIEL